MGGRAVRLSASEVLAAADASGFDATVVEKALHLMHLLNVLNSHPSLRGTWVLKGGTALNLFVLRYPRLSVDIDLNYIGALGRERMLADRPRIEQAAEAVFSREGYTIRRVPSEHAGGKWRLSYASYLTQSGNLDVDMNFMFRRPLWEPRLLDSHSLGSFRANGVPVLDLHELVAGKLAALLSRRQARDLFDCHQILGEYDLDRDRLRIAFVVFGGMNRKDWRTVSVDDVDYDGLELAKQLGPTLRSRTRRDQPSLTAFGTRLVEELRKALSAVLPLTATELAFLDLLLVKGEIDATILTSDTALQRRIHVQPLLAWKALNVRRHQGLS